MAVVCSSSPSTVSNTSTPSVTVTDVTFDDSYPTGGEDVSPADLGLHRVNFAIATIKSGAGAVNVASAHYDPTSAKLVVRDETLAEIDDEADLTDLIIQVAAFGR